MLFFGYFTSFLEKTWKNARKDFWRSWKQLWNKIDCLYRMDVDTMRCKISLAMSWWRLSKFVCKLRRLNFHLSRQIKWLSRKATTSEGKLPRAYGKTAPRQELRSNIDIRFIWWFLIWPSLTDATSANELKVKTDSSAVAYSFRWDELSESEATSSERSAAMWCRHAAAQPVTWSRAFKGVTI